jgi:segregation and condensation protein B
MNNDERLDERSRLEPGDEEASGLEPGGDGPDEPSPSGRGSRKKGRHKEPETANKAEVPEAGSQAETPDDTDETEEAEAAAAAEDPEAPSEAKEPTTPGAVAALKKHIEAVLFATDSPLSARRIAEALETTEGTVRGLVDELRAEYDASSRAFTVEEIAGGYQVLTRSEYAGVVQRLIHVERQHKLSGAALETLAIVAYKQPIMRAEVEDIRGVQVQPLLKSLMEQGLVRIVGRAEALGRPMLYGTTQKFLLQFGLKSAKDLPPVEELRKRQ